MNWKRLAMRLLYPPLWLMLVLTVFCTAGLVGIFLRGWDTHPAAVAMYVLSFYTLTVIVLRCVQVFPTHYHHAKQKVHAHPLSHRYLTDVAFKTHVSLYASLAINLLYVALNLISGFWARSAWFYILAGYYTILSLMRFLLLRYVKRNPIGKALIAELQLSRLCAVILLLVNLALSGVVMMIMYQDRGANYPGFLIYVVAGYTFYITIFALRDLVKYRQYHSPVMSTAKVISLASALVSVLSLETAMLSQFGAENSEEFRRIMIAATGAGISVIVVAMSLYIIVRNTREIRSKHHGR